MFVKTIKIKKIKKKKKKCLPNPFLTKIIGNKLNDYAVIT